MTEVIQGDCVTVMATMDAASVEGFSCVGIEREPEYVAIPQARLNGVQQGIGL